MKLGRTDPDPAKAPVERAAAGLRHVADTMIDPAIEGEPRPQWDRILAKLPVLVILIRSDVAMMDRLGGHGRPLFGRLSPMVVPALNRADVAGALRGHSATDAFDAYLVTGGYPRIVRDLAQRRSAGVAGYVRSPTRPPAGQDRPKSARTRDSADLAQRAAAYGRDRVKIGRKPEKIAPGRQ